MSGKEDLLPDVSDLDLDIANDGQDNNNINNIEENKKAILSQEQQPTSQVSTINDNQNVENNIKQGENVNKPEALSETKLMHDRIDELSKALTDERRRSQNLNQQLLLTKQQALTPPPLSRNPSKIPSKHNIKTFIRNHKQVLIIVVILLVVSLIAALLVNKTSSLKKSSEAEESSDEEEEKETKE